MKKQIFIFALLAVTLTVFSQTAVDFTLTDCSSNSRHLYSILDQGKIVILIYEHECSSCTQGTANVTSVLNTNYPGDTNIMVMYLDNGGNSCSTTAGWISTNNFVAGPYFEYSSNNSSPYGSGMPVVVVASGSDHMTFLTALGVAYTDTATVHNAIKSAYTHLSGIESMEISDISFNIYPNPANDNITIVYKNNNLKKAIAEIYDMQGRLFFSAEINKQITNINISGFFKGIYLLKLTSDNGIYFEKVIVQ